MEALIIESTSKSPYISLNPETGVIDICARSIMENPPRFYESIISWLLQYSLSPAFQTTINVHLDYFNTASSKCLLDVFKVAERLFQHNKAVQVNWTYEKNDEDMLKAGEDYESMVSVPFKFIEIIKPNEKQRK